MTLKSELPRSFMLSNGIIVFCAAQNCFEDLRSEENHKYQHRNRHVKKRTEVEWRENLKCSSLTYTFAQCFSRNNATTRRENTRYFLLVLSRWRSLVYTSLVLSVKITGEERFRWRSLEDFIFIQIRGVFSVCVSNEQ